MEENQDFYIENGFYVFTEQYHIKRGYCCKSECRHCPWKFKKNKEKINGNPRLDNTDKNKL